MLFFLTVILNSICSCQQSSKADAPGSINYGFKFFYSHGTNKQPAYCLLKSPSFQHELRNTLHIQHQQGKSPPLERHNQITVFRRKSHTLLYLSLLLLANATDVELNPGPCTRSNFQCQLCDCMVTSQQRGLACDDCHEWYHVECMHMSTPVYRALTNVRVTWQCTSCSMPQFSTGLFDSSFKVETSNSFDTLFSSTSNSASSSLHEFFTLDHQCATLHQGTPSMCGLQKKLAMQNLI